MIVEQRIYTLVPGMVGRYMDFYTKEGQAIQRPLLERFLGYYCSEIGTMNQVVHMWAYKDFSEREARRVRQNADSRWIPYAAEARKIIVAQENHALRPIGAWASVLARYFGLDGAPAAAGGALKGELPASAMVEWTATRLKWGATDAYLVALDQYEKTVKVGGPNHLPSQYLALSGPEALVYTFQVFDSLDEGQAYHDRQRSCPAWAALQKAGADLVTSRERRFLKPFDCWIPELGILRQFANDQNSMAARASL